MRPLRRRTLRAAVTSQAIRDAAWTYIEFQTGPEAERITVDTFVEYGLTEFIRPALIESAGYHDLLNRIPAGAAAALGQPRPRTPGWSPTIQGFAHVMTRELGMAIEAVFADRPDPRTGAYQRDLDAIMKEICRNVNTMIMGKMPDAEVRRRSRVGWVVFGVMAVGLAIAAAADRQAGHAGPGAARRHRRASAWAAIRPGGGSTPGSS